VIFPSLCLRALALEGRGTDPLSEGLPRTCLVSLSLFTRDSGLGLRFEGCVCTALRVHALALCLSLFFSFY
jgi:hypothetical protein